MKNELKKKYGRLQVLSEAGRDKGYVYWLCQCNCGERKIVRGFDLRRGGVRSCGCLRKENPPNVKHRLTKTRFYRIWSLMKGRCKNKKTINFHLYGGRGIKICKRWELFENFRNDMYETYLAHIVEYGEKNTSIDRIDNSKNYSKKNCRWATAQEQCNNRRNNRFISIEGQRMTFAQGARLLKISKELLRDRIETNFYKKRNLSNKIYEIKKK